MSLQVSNTEISIVNNDKDKLIVREAEDDPDILILKIRNEDFWFSKKDSDSIIEAIEELR